MINLTPYKAIQSNLFVRIEVAEYKAAAGDEYSSEVIRVSDRLTSYTLNGEVYTGAGRLMSIGSTVSELRPSNGQLTLSLSGIPNSSIFEIVNSKIKGCPVTIYRVIFDVATGLALNTEGNPLTRFKGFVNNYTLVEEYDNQTRISNNMLTLTCASSVDVLANKYGGRKTNPDSMKKYYPLDLSMDRVPALEDTSFDFGRTT